MFYLNSSKKKYRTKDKVTWYIHHALKLSSFKWGGHSTKFIHLFCTKTWSDEEYWNYTRKFAFIFPFSSTLYDESNRPKLFIMMQFIRKYMISPFCFHVVGSLFTKNYFPCRITQLLQTIQTRRLRLGHLSKCFFFCISANW